VSRYSESLIEAGFFLHESFGDGAVRMSSVDRGRRDVPSSRNRARETSCRRVPSNQALHIRWC